MRDIMQGVAELDCFLGVVMKDAKLSFSFVLFKGVKTLGWDGMGVTVRLIEGLVGCCTEQDTYTSRLSARAV